MAILADEVFLDFALDDFAQHPRTFAANADALTFTMSGISKICGLPQMKAAWLIASGPDDLKSQALERLEVISDTYLSVSAPIQHALPEFLARRQKFQREFITRVRANLAELDRQIAAQKLSSRLEFQGGWYAILRTPATRAHRTKQKPLSISSKPMACRFIRVTFTISQATAILLRA